MLTSIYQSIFLWGKCSWCVCQLQSKFGILDYIQCVFMADMVIMLVCLITSAKPLESMVFPALIYWSRSCWNVVTLKEHDLTLFRKYLQSFVVTLLWGSHYSTSRSSPVLVPHHQTFPRKMVYSLFLLHHIGKLPFYLHVLFWCIFSRVQWQHMVIVITKIRNNIFLILTRYTIMLFYSLH